MTPQEQTQLQRYANLLYGSGYGNNPVMQGRMNPNSSTYAVAPQQLPVAATMAPPNDNYAAHPNPPMPPPRPRQYSVGVGPVTAMPQADVSPTAFASPVATAGSGNIPPSLLTSANAANYPMPMSQSPQMMAGRMQQMGPEASQQQMQQDPSSLYSAIMQSYMQHPGT